MKSRGVLQKIICQVYFLELSNNLKANSYFIKKTEKNKKNLDKVEWRFIIWV